MEYFFGLMELVLSLHNILRWIILLALILLILKTTWEFFQNKKLPLDKNFPQDSSDSFLKSKQILRKLFLMLTIFSDLQFIFGLILYFFNYFHKNLWNDILLIIKQKELRVIFIEHPILMIIFIGLIHYQNVLIKKIENYTQYKKIIFVLVISLIILLIGIPWFRPLFRI
jgi:hypothetical protein